MANPNDPYVEPIPQGIYPPVGIRNPVPKRVSRQTAYEAIQSTIIDEFKHTSWFFNNLPLLTLTDSVSGGGTTTYKYYRNANLASATAREYNSEVSETYVELKSVSTDLANLASAIAMDVDLIELGGMVNQWQMQMSFAVRAISDLLNEMVIRGDPSVPRDPDNRAVGPGSFDGLDKLIRTESLHCWPDPLDLTGLSLITSGSTADPAMSSAPWFDITDMLMSRLRKLQPYPTFILGNGDAIEALSALARRTGTYTTTEGAWGSPIGAINGISLVPMGNRCAKNEEIIPTVKTEAATRENGMNPNDYAFKTTLYVGSFGPNAIQGLTVPDGVLKIRMPDFSTSGYVKKADIEMKIGMAMMSSHSCGMFETVFVPKNLIEYPDYLDTAE